MMIRNGRVTLGAYPSDSYYDPSRPSWLPYWMDTASEEALKAGMYPDVNSLKPLPTPGAPVPQPPVGWEKTSGNIVALDPITTTPDWMKSAQLTMDAAARQIQNEKDAADEEKKKTDNTLMWVAVGGATLLLILLSRR